MGGLWELPTSKLPTCKWLLTCAAGSEDLWWFRAMVSWAVGVKACRSSKLKTLVFCRFGL